MNNIEMEICVDFDGTCVAHEFPKVGKEIGSVPILKKLVEAGHKLILFTMRSDHDETTNSASPEFPNISGGKYLSDAVNWFKKHDIPLYGIQTNPAQKTWTSSPKAYGQLYIDDAALGCPLVYDSNEDRPYVDWKKVERYLIDHSIIEK